MYFIKTTLSLAILAITTIDSSSAYECGKFNELTGRIYNGVNAKNWPWYVLINVIRKDVSDSGGDCDKRINSNVCGGTIVDRYNILSAAHCLPVKYVNDSVFGDKRHAEIDLEVLCKAKIMFINKMPDDDNDQSESSENLSTTIINTQTRATNKLDQEDQDGLGIPLKAAFQASGPIIVNRQNQMTVHQDYNGTTFLNDIMLFHLDEPINFGVDPHDGLAPACLPVESDQSLESYVKTSDCRIVGFGAYDNNPNADPPARLQQASVVIQKNEICQKQPESVYQNETQLCARGKLRRGKPTNACIGDSGGPVHCRWLNATNKWTVVGVASHKLTNTCDEEGSKIPAYFTRVDAYSNWIRRNLKPKKMPIGFGLRILSPKQMHDLEMRVTGKRKSNRKTKDKVVTTEETSQTTTTTTNEPTTTDELTTTEEPTTTTTTNEEPTEEPEPEPAPKPRRRHRKKPKSSGTQIIINNNNYND